ncbi:MAG: hypothetical protein QXD84_05290 [Thermoplasmata archaeon]
MLTSVLGALLLVLFWGLNLKFWTLIGIVLVIMALASAYYIARKDYIGGAVPSGLAGVLILFIALPPLGWILLAAVLLFISSGLAFVLYEVE